MIEATSVSSHSKANVNFKEVGVWQRYSRSFKRTVKDFELRVVERRLSDEIDLKV